MCGLGGMFLEEFGLEEEAQGALLMAAGSSRAHCFHRPDKHFSSILQQGALALFSKQPRALHASKTEPPLAVPTRPAFLVTSSSPASTRPPHLFEISLGLNLLGIDLRSTGQRQRTRISMWSSGLADTGNRQPEFRSPLCHLPALCLWAVCLGLPVPQNPPLSLTFWH